MFRRCTDLLSKRDRLLVWISLALNLALVGLDTLGILAIAALVAVATFAVKSEQPSGLVADVIEFLGIENLSPQQLGTILGAFAAFSLIGKTILSFYLTKRQLVFLSSRDAQVSSNLVKDILEQDLSQMRRFTSFEYNNAITLGSSAVTSGIISQTTMLISELFLQLALISTIFAFSPEIAILSLLYFGSLLVLLTKVLGRKARALSEEISNVNVASASSLFDALQNYRFLTVTQGYKYYQTKIGFLRKDISNLVVKQSMLSVWSKYSFEVAILLAGVIFGAYSFLTYDAVKAGSMIAIFLATSYRLAPSLMKIQNSLVQFKGSIGSANVFFLIRDAVPTSTLSEFKEISDISRTSNFQEGKLVKFEGVQFAYRGSNDSALKRVDLSIQQGDHVGIVGPSGAGKSTFVDLLLGVISPGQGIVELAGVPARLAVKNKLIKVGYVPQEIILSNDSIESNVAFSIEKSLIDHELVQESLEAVGLNEWIKTLPNGLLTKVGELGSLVSGGQRQRIGIARALYLKPQLLVLDEATSSLDADSEAAISDFVVNLPKATTVIVIAHRLSTIRSLQRIFYFSEGRVIASGNFDQLRSEVPDFDRQANLLGIEK